jgi:hypothetical protein
MSRFAAIVVLAGAAVASFPGIAAAQFGRQAFLGQGPLYVYPNGSGGYGVQLNFGINAMTPYGPMTLGYAYPYSLGPSYVPDLTPSYNSGSGYMTGGSYGGYTSFDPLGTQQDLAAAQKATSARVKQDQAKELIEAQWAYETLGVTGRTAVQGARDQEEELQKALIVKDESEVASGMSLNRILVAIVIAEGKGAKGVSAFLPPQLLDDIRFSGGPSADLLNLVRLSGKLPFPPNFPGPTLQDQQTALEADFAAAIAPLRAGKAVDLAKVNKFAATLKRLEAASPAVIRNISYDDAIAARKFLNRCDAAVTALKGTNLAGLINPKWSTEGISVADLVKHMKQYKFTFAPAPTGGEASYLTLHRALATYLFVLTQAKK